MPASAAPVAHAQPADDVVGRRIASRPEARDRRGADRAEDASSGDDDDAESGLIAQDQPDGDERVIVEYLPGGYQVRARMCEKSAIRQPD
jgi:hypothetical protein